MNRRNKLIIAVILILSFLILGLFPIFMFLFKPSPAFGNVLEVYFEFDGTVFGDDIAGEGLSFRFKDSVGGVIVYSGTTGADGLARFYPTDLAAGNYLAEVLWDGIWQGAGTFGDGSVSEYLVCDYLDPVEIQGTFRWDAPEIGYPLIDSQDVQLYWFDGVDWVVISTITTSASGTATFTGLIIGSYSFYPDNRTIDVDGSTYSPIVDTFYVEPIKVRNKGSKKMKNVKLTANFNKMNLEVKERLLNFISKKRLGIVNSKSFKSLNLLPFNFILLLIQLNFVVILWISPSTTHFFLLQQKKRFLSKLCDFEAKNQNLSKMY